MEKKILDLVSDEIKRDTSNDGALKDALLNHLERLKEQRSNIMFVGATGVGKSSTINAIFNTKIARVGYSVDPETDTVKKYEIDNMVLWDTPGLGDDPAKDKRYAAMIADALKARGTDGQFLIDEVVVLIDGSNRDMKTAYEILEKIVIPYIGKTDRIVIAINQCDMALKGRHWDHDQKKPDARLVSFLEEKTDSVKKRIEGSTGVSLTPVYYSALYHYNISKLLLSMVKNMPETKRFFFADSLNQDPDVWGKNDSIKDYNTEIQQEIKGSLTKALDGAAKGAVAGATVGSLIPVIGPVLGAAAGSLLGFLGGLSGR
jgi:Predicted GTPase